MASSLYNLALDFSKELNYTKAIMARQGDKGITVTVKPYLNGLQMDTSGGTFTLKGTTPSNRYVDSVATSVTSEEVTFSLDGTFMSEAGYYKHCYVEYRKDNQILTTQDIIFFSLGVSDISQGQADEYVSQLEALIKKYNETFEDFMVEIVNQSSQIQNDLNTMSRKAKELKTQMDGLQEQIAALDLDAWKDEVLKTSKGYTDSKYEEASQTFVAQESLEAGPLLFKNTQITTQDWNDITESGIYYCAAASGPNMPYTGNLYGILTVYNDAAVIIQKYEFNTSVYMRTFAGNPPTWGKWKKIALASEIVNLTSDQDIGGNKNFSGDVTVKGKSVLTVDDNKYEIINLSVSNGNTGTSRLYREGKTVTIYFVALNGKSSGGNNSIILTIPEGYRPPISFEQLISSTDRSTLNSAQIEIGADGGIRWRRNAAYGSDFTFAVTYNM